MSPIISKVSSPGGAGGSSFLRTFRNRRFIVKPTMLAPTNGASEIVRKPTFVASSYSFVGSVGSHLSTDWQVSTSSTFGTIAAQSLNDTSNKTSYTLPSDLNLNTLYYVRARYTDGTYISEWSDPISFTTTQFLPYFSNGTQTITNDITWTVPSGIGKIRVRFYTGYARNNTNYSGYGTSEFEFDVTPGESLRINSVMIGVPENGGPIYTQPFCFIAQGQWGGYGTHEYESNYTRIDRWARRLTDCGGTPGTPNGGYANTPDRGVSYPPPTPGTTTAAGAAGSPNGFVYFNSPTNYYYPSGGPLGRYPSNPSVYAASRSAGYNHNSEIRYNGAGGFGWFSGGSGILEQGGTGIYSGGAGGSSYNNTPSSRNPVTKTNFTFVSGSAPPGDSPASQSETGSKCIITW